MAEANEQAPLRVLLLEDSPLDAELAIARLEKAGLVLDATTACDRASYFEHLVAREYDLILADYALPDFDGLAALKAARALYPHLPFIFISGRVGEEVAIETLQRGATDYVLKHRPERLVPAVTRALKEAAEHKTRMLVERRFRESESRFHHVIDALPQMVWIAATDGTLLYTNKTWNESVPAGTRSWLDDGVIHPEDRAACVAARRRAIAAQEAFCCECRLHRASDRSWRWHLVRMVPLAFTRGEDGSSRLDWLGTATDLQEQKLNEEALRTAEKLAVTGRMMAGIAHEINNPLESVSNLIFLARMEAKDNPQVIEYLEMTENELARVASITKQTLQFYRDPLTPGPVDAREILEEVIRLFATRLRAKGVGLMLEVEKTIVFEAIKGEIRQVLINLVGNAIDAVPAGGEIAVTAKIVRHQEREMVQMQIRDNGVGLAAAQLGRLFQPFFSTKGAHGTGLGLWVSKGIVEKHDGTIKLASHRENGHNSTTATVLLPLQVAGELMLNQNAS
jgi:signal transduction histidine kinase/CheY-like chemotaxis protein